MRFLTGSGSYQIVIGCLQKRYQDGPMWSTRSLGMLWGCERSAFSLHTPPYVNNKIKPSAEERRDLLYSTM